MSEGTILWYVLNVTINDKYIKKCIKAEGKNMILCKVMMMIMMMCTL